MNPFRYCGEYWDKETETYYLRARYYDPKLGRFLCEDPIGAGLNWYTYCMSNPVMYIDPLGLSEESPYHHEKEEEEYTLEERLWFKYHEFLKKGDTEGLEKIKNRIEQYYKYNEINLNILTIILIITYGVKTLPPSSIMPIENAVKNDDYPYYTGTNVLHNGTDFGTPEGTPVYAAVSGKVVNVSTKINYNWKGSSGLDTYGIYIFIDTGSGIEMRYAHLNKVYVSIGDYVDMGVVIGLSGNTGRSFGAHLHFEVRKNGKVVNPYDYLP